MHVLGGMFVANLAYGSAIFGEGVLFTSWPQGLVSPPGESANSETPRAFPLHTMFSLDMIPQPDRLAFGAPLISTSTATSACPKAITQYLRGVLTRAATAVATSWVLGTALPFS